jgi:hypothetical protein
LISAVKLNGIPLIGRLASTHPRAIAMMQRALASTLLLMTLTFATASAVYAQSVSDLEHLPRALDLRMRALNISRKNLEQIDASHETQERDAVRSVIDADVVVFSAGVKVFTVAYIARGLKNPEDFRFAQAQFRTTVKSFVTTADEELQLLDASLANIATSAALVEAKNIRDTVAELRDFLKPFAPEG